EAAAGATAAKLGQAIRASPGPLRLLLMLTGTSEIDFYASMNPTTMPHSNAEAPPKRSEPAPSQNSLIGVSARRLKKREIDRRCQRQARERTKSRIAYLEGLLESLKHTDGDDRGAALMKRLEDTEKERDMLAQALRDVQKAISSYRTVDENVEPGNSSPVLKNIQPQANETDINAFHCAAPTRYSCQDTTPTMTMPISMSALAPTHVMTPTTMSMCTTSSVGAIVPACNDCCRDSHLKTTAVGPNHWQFACMTLLEPFQSQTPIMTPEEDIHTYDIPVRAVMEGWNAVEQQIQSGMTSPENDRFACEVLDEQFEWSEDLQPANYVDSYSIPTRALLEGGDVVRQENLHPSQMILSRMDEFLFPSIPKPERLAMLKAMHLLLQFTLQPSLERFMRLPWYIYGRSQGLPHTYAVDFFA
ncbi:hypothetical protein DV736_g5325, partial [Chaetothyriales sp. CBS 134916]